MINPEDLFKLKELIPFYSIAFAINMAFSFWDSLRESNIRCFDEMYRQKNSDFENALVVNKVDAKAGNSCRDSFKSSVQGKKQVLVRISNIGKYLCGVTCLILAFSIAYIGMYTGTSLTFKFTIFTIVGSISSFSLMMLCSYSYRVYSLRNISEATDNQIKGMESVIVSLTENYQSD